MKNQKGITLVTLMLTMIIIFILGTISVYTGVEAYKTIKIQNFMAQMRVVQERVNFICDDWKNWDGYDISDSQNFKNYIDSYLAEKNGGTNKARASQHTEAEFDAIITDSSKTILTGEDTVIGNYYHFTSEELEKYLELKDLKIDVIINFATRNFVEKDGVESINSAGEVKMYYVLDELIEAQRITETIIQNIVKDETLSEYYQRFDVEFTINTNDNKVVKITPNTKVELPVKKLWVAIDKEGDPKNFSEDDWTEVTTGVDLTKSSFNYEIKKSGIYNFRISDSHEDGSRFFYSREPIVVEFANKPVLEQAMSPIGFSDSGEVLGFSEDDINWYNYHPTQKKWANIKLADGSMYVWIPRFAYKINDNGTINIKFLKNATNVTYDGDSLTGYTVHPAFTADTGYAEGGWDTELSGIWVAKFNASLEEIEVEDKNLKKTVKINKVSTIPGVEPTRVTNFFEAIKVCREMTKIPDYGFSDTIKASSTMKTNLDYNLSKKYNTHLIKSSEMGALLYLTRSSYGRNTMQIPMNNAGLTGGSDTANSIFVINKNFSTTANAYGVYDLTTTSGEYVSACIDAALLGVIAYNEKNIYDSYEEYKNSFDNNSSANLRVEAEKLINSNNRIGMKKYITFYNYNKDANTSIKGDGMTERNFATNSYYPTLEKPIFIRGFDANNMFSYEAVEFEENKGFYLRPVIIIEN